MLMFDTKRYVDQCIWATVTPLSIPRNYKCFKQFRSGFFFLCEVRNCDSEMNKYINPRTIPLHPSLETKKYRQIPTPGLVDWWLTTVSRSPRIDFLKDYLMLGNVVTERVLCLVEWGDSTMSWSLDIIVMSTDATRHPRQILSLQTLPCTPCTSQLLCLQKPVLFFILLAWLWRYEHLKPQLTAISLIICCRKCSISALLVPFISLVERLERSMRLTVNQKFSIVLS